MTGSKRSENTPRRKKVIQKLVLLATLALYLTLTSLTIGCPIKFLTGISCPGCGMSRALFCALKGSIREAFYYHPLLPTAPLLVAYMMFDNSLKRRTSHAVALSFIVLYISVYIVRIIFFANDIVSIDLSNGLIVKLSKRIFEGIK
jgi:hypothetical protein